MWDARGAMCDVLYIETERPDGVVACGCGVRLRVPGASKQGTWRLRMWLGVRVTTLIN